MFTEDFIYIMGPECGIINKASPHLAHLNPITDVTSFHPKPGCPETAGFLFGYPESVFIVVKSSLSMEQQVHEEILHLAESNNVTIGMWYLQASYV